MTLLGDRLLAVHDAFAAAGLPHAFGGAIALGYCSREPRGTRDVDVNVFVGKDRTDEVLSLLPDDITVDDSDRGIARRDGQVRVRWDETPIDIFFQTHDFHREIVSGVTTVPFEGRTIPILGCDALMVFKAMFGRTRDWGDIEEMLAAGAADAHRALGWLRTLLGHDDSAVVRLSGLLNR